MHGKKNENERVGTQGRLNTGTKCLYKVCTCEKTNDRLIVIGR